MERMLDNLFSNIGRKIQKIAKIAFVISLIAGVLCAVLGLFSDFYYGVLIGLGGILISYLNCLFLCAIGQLVHDVHMVKNKLCDDSDSESFVLPEI